MVVMLRPKKRGVKRMKSRRREGEVKRNGSKEIRDRSDKLWEKRQNLIVIDEIKQ